MGTPVMAASNWMKHSFWAFSALWAFTLVVSRIYIYHDAYNKGIQQLEHDKWLLERCQDPEFYANISRSSPDLCAEVEANSRASVHLKALNTMAINTHMCGTHPCSDLLATIVAKMGWQAFAVFALAILIFPNILYAIFQIMGYRGIQSTERALMEKHARYGLAYYPRFEDDATIVCGDIATSQHMMPARKRFSHVEEEPKAKVVDLQSC